MPHTFRVCEHFLASDHLLYVFNAGVHRVRPTAQSLNPPLVVDGEEVMELVGTPPDGESNDESVRWLVHNLNATFRMWCGGQPTAEWALRHFMTIRGRAYRHYLKADLFEAELQRALQVASYLGVDCTKFHDKLGMQKGGQ